MGFLGLTAPSSTADMYMMHWNSSNNQWERLTTYFLNIYLVRQQQALVHLHKDRVGLYLDLVLLLENAKTIPLS